MGELLTGRGAPCTLRPVAQWDLNPTLPSPLPPSSRWPAHPLHQTHRACSLLAASGDVRAAATAFRASVRSRPEWPPSPAGGWLGAPPSAWPGLASNICRSRVPPSGQPQPGQLLKPRLPRTRAGLGHTDRCRTEGMPCSSSHSRSRSWRRRRARPAPTGRSRAHAAGAGCAGRALHVAGLLWPRAPPAEP